MTQLNLIMSLFFVRNETDNLRTTSNWHIFFILKSVKIKPGDVLSENPNFFNCISIFFTDFICTFVFWKP